MILHTVLFTVFAAIRAFANCVEITSVLLMNISMTAPVAATQVLGIYPSTIRRRILRHLYLDQLHKCFLFADCKLKFLDALLAGARVELFMPQVGSARQPV